MYNIVIVEDELIELEALRIIINRDISGVKIFEATKGSDAIRLIDDLDHIDIMLVDINIPLPNGLEVIRYLRQKSRDTKIIVITANDDVEMVRNMFEFKVDDYLLKPVKPQYLIKAIKNSLKFDEDLNTKIKEQKAYISELISSCNYVQWNDLIINNVINQAYKSEKDQHKIITNFIMILQQIAKSNGWKIDELNSNEKLLNQINFDERSYYNTLRTLLSIGNSIFDTAFLSSGAKLNSIHRAQYYIERNIFKNMTLDDVADHAYISACYLSRLFKKQFGIGYSEYLTRRKMVIAKLLLNFSDLQINAIALELSYQDANYFCRLFKKETGLSPSEYRKNIVE
ncbi:response regulator transcription factor [Budvicia aquatica]|uniref:Bacillibactin transport regulator n=1 Tax=Budvicia aquatica TaxID=82979 RepID=A0A2C6DQL6_9GAMM|nr:AraC family transcriptional regulator [Budvicia aquatica]PHI31094.1 DNA-binding response regulator [Budvicia aquatica]GKX53709.1 DNA-binding response regulator [Budvicia aquatica]VFS51332.1 Bacillibactin transport regulator [Budvicia aquatica]